MDKLSGNEIALAIRALARPPFAEKVSVDGLRAAYASKIEVRLYPETARTLREAIEDGITAGAFSQNELPEVRKLFAGKLASGRTTTGPIVNAFTKPNAAARKKIPAPRVTPRAFVK